MNLKISQARLNTIFNKSKNKRIAVVGDVMLDKYVYGDVTRVSPEAPVQVVDISNTEYKLGGAANVANNIKSLGCEPILIGVIGDDNDGMHYLNTMRNLDLPTQGIYKDRSRRTTSKTRVIAHSQHVLRIDSEVKNDLISDSMKRILNFFKRNLDSFDGVILQDYNKGVLSKEMISRLILMCKISDVPIFVDPKFNNFFEYKDVTVFKPNKKEVQDVLGKKIDSDASVIEAGKKILERLNCEWLVLTRGEKGMTLFDKEGRKIIAHHIPTRARKAADVSGAGDTVISTLAVTMIGGANMKESLMISNQAAGIVCEEVGIVPIYKKTLIDSFKKAS